MKRFSNPKHDQFRQASLTQLKNLRPSDIVIYDQQPIESNYTIVLRLNQQTKAKITTLVDNIKAIDANQFFIPIDQLHITLLGFIDPTTNQQKLIALTKKVIGSYDFQFHLFGLGSNAHAASVSAYPLFDIGKLRDQLKTNINSKTDDYKVHLDEYHFMGWVNFMRYLKQPKQKLLDFFLSQQNLDLGEISPSKIQLLINTSKVLSPGKYKVIYEQEI